MSDSPGGTLVPPWYKPSPLNRDEENIASLLWGFTLGLGVWTGTKAIQQTMVTLKRIHRVNAYIALIWAQWISNMIMGIISWIFLRGWFGPSFEFFFFVLVLWVFQVQCLMQIIINRIALLMHVPAHATRLKWGVFLVLLVINISVFCVWIPARLQISEGIIHANDIWDRIEKGLFLVIDLGLNLTFIYLVRSRLIAYGLTKYTVLFRFNLAMICISISLDILIIGLMSLPNTFVYGQSHPLTYLAKLHIELNMAQLIAKIVKASHEINSFESHLQHSTVRRSESTRRTIPKRVSGFFGNLFQNAEDLSKRRDTPVDLEPAPSAMYHPSASSSTPATPPPHEDRFHTLDHVLEMGKTGRHSLSTHEPRRNSYGSV
ncbi:hypothetical protein VD0002_g9779 [Verticillium dahliae]|uniref:Integral membrane protein n=2 Tax=Verticillium dahliae TaxID=27337 RepID=A0AA44WMX8_VERDA|nr:Nicotinamide-nucleotide adenylyltransferase 1 [Verticillium dahliae VDG2]KAH6704542.1 hypothetical protein EV126DRAFT_335772 [Verticillium dahliae]PNH33695.1 hypothetical protein BJF96_g3307 [Verticillium dahliae]PNH41380.1 hypothetical protein VD0003_g9976 [Verticillium dahliae]PNH56626.1 hypothetical protein VD0002_g9779 [Verticillium dahliae]